VPRTGRTRKEVAAKGGVGREADGGETRHGPQPVEVLRCVRGRNGVGVPPRRILALVPVVFAVKDAAAARNATARGLIQC